MSHQHLANAWRLLNDGDNEAARAKFAKIVAANPQDSEALIGLGKALARLGRYGEALETFKAVLILDPNEAEAHHGAGWILHYRMKEWREAEIHIQQAVALAPDVAKYHLLAVESARKRRDMKATLAHLEAANRIAPDALDGRVRRLLTHLRIADVADKLFTPLVACAMLVAPMYACCLLMAGQKWGIGAGALPFGIASVGYALQRRYRLVIGSVVLGILWVVLAFLLIEWLGTR